MFNPTCWGERWRLFRDGLMLIFFVVGWVGWNWCRFLQKLLQWISQQFQKVSFGKQCSLANIWKYHKTPRDCFMLYVNKKCRSFLTYYWDIIILFFGVCHVHKCNPALHMEQPSTEDTWYETFRMVPSAHFRSTFSTFSEPRANKTKLTQHWPAKHFKGEEATHKIGVLKNNSRIAMQVGCLMEPLDGICQCLRVFLMRFWCRFQSKLRKLRISVSQSCCMCI